MTMGQTISEVFSPEAKRGKFQKQPTVLTQGPAIREASRCLWCHDGPCVHGCPAGVNVPEFIARIRSQDFLGAAAVVYLDNPLGAICGRVCPTEALCEKACITRHLGGAVAIGRLQRFVCDQMLDDGKVLFTYALRRPEKVAVLGGGPAGLSCTHFLRRAGYSVALFERESALGGLLRWGIPTYRLPRAVCEKELSLVATGLDWRHIAVTASQAPSILKDFHAMFVATGLGPAAALGIPGEQTPGVIPAMQLLHDVSAGRERDHDLSGKDVAVVGCGATALDSARTALRLGADNVWVIYRRAQADMPGFLAEYQAALDEGVQFLWLAQPASIAQRDGRLEVTFDRMRLAGNAPDGRHAVTRSGARFELRVDVLVVAVGSRTPDDARERWSGFQDAWPAPGKVFWGGDLTGAGTVVQAIADGKSAAARIDSWLQGKMETVGVARSSFAPERPAGPHWGCEED